MKASAVVDGKLRIDEEVCNNCGRCVGKCPFHALDEGAYGYKIYIGGRWGKKVAHGHALSPVFTSEEEVLSIIEKAILLFREQGETGERFADTIARLGFENVERQLLSDEILSRREAIIGAKAAPGRRRDLLTAARSSALNCGSKLHVGKNSSRTERKARKRPKVPGFSL